MGRKLKMGKWEGFDIVRALVDGKNKITGARCKSCLTFLAGTGTDNLSSHRRTCSSSTTVAANSTSSVRQPLPDVDINRSPPSPKRMNLRNAATNQSNQSCSPGQGLDIASPETAGNTEPLLFKFCLYYGIPFEKIQHPISVKLLQSLNGDFKMPSPQDLKSSIMTRVVKESRNQLKKTMFADVMIVSLAAPDVVVCHVMTRDQKLILLKTCTIVACADRRAATENFCSIAVTFARASFGVRIRYIFYSGVGILRKDGEVEDIHYFMCPFLHEVVESLLKFTDKGMSTASAIQKHKIYTCSLRKMMTKMDNKSYSMAEALQDFFVLMEEGV
ncbi:hypothetical protein QAD02_000522 [Eretmocerus hayati]|uniref:Uncharacterized protein n=1 Tax=Eretmocerus hayati TaxID=131215 RepID=A0ACC2NDN5_9HYME|nr:hypothetical protein QAD02_000522 [Eretmocerus hayati]